MKKINPEKKKEFQVAIFKTISNTPKRDYI